MADTLRFKSAVPRRPEHFIVQETPEDCACNVEFDAPLWLPASGDPRATVVMINGFAEDCAPENPLARPRVYREADPVLYEKYLSTVFSKNGYASLLLPLPFEFMRHAPREDMTEYHPGPRCHRSPDRFYLGYEQAVKDAFKIVDDELAAYYRSRGITQPPTFLLGYSLGGMVTLAAYLSRAKDPSLPVFAGYLLLASGLTFLSIETTAPATLSLVVNLTPDQVKELGEWYRDSENIRRMKERAELLDDGLDALLWTVFEEIWMRAAEGPDSEEWLSYDKRRLRAIVSGKDKIIRNSEHGGVSKLEDIISRSSGTARFDDKGMAFHHILNDSNSVWRDNHEVYLERFVAYIEGVLGA